MLDALALVSRHPCSKGGLTWRSVRTGLAAALLVLLLHALDAAAHARTAWRALTIDPALYASLPSAADCRCIRDNSSSSSSSAEAPLEYTAVMIETRATPAVVFAVRHMACALPARSWALLLVTTRAMRPFLLREFGDLLAGGRLRVWELAEAQRTLERWCPPGTRCSSGRSCAHAPHPASAAARLPWSRGWGLANEILLSEEFYRVIPSEHFLLFQTDGLLCRALPDSDAAVLARYDYVGSPWAWEEEGDGANRPRAPRGGNGGLSWRGKGALLRALAAARRAQWVEAPLTPTAQNSGWNEDMWFAIGGARSALAAVGGRLPPAALAKAFGVEELYHAPEAGAQPARPLSFHKPWRYLGENALRALIEACPVVAECLGWTAAAGAPLSCAAGGASGAGPSTLGSLAEGGVE